MPFSLNLPLDQLSIQIAISVLLLPGEQIQYIEKT